MKIIRIRTNELLSELFDLATCTLRLREIGNGNCFFGGSVLELFRLKSFYEFDTQNIRIENYFWNKSRKLDLRFLKVFYNTNRGSGSGR